jgi:hypothetical protein
MGREALYQTMLFTVTPEIATVFNVGGEVSDRTRLQGRAPKLLWLQRGSSAQS